MIKELNIQNYALIESLRMEPSNALSIITGETGAGKSIMLGAIGLLLGNRSDTKALLDDSKKCIVEGIFDVSDHRLEALFEEHEIDFEHECIIRREINPAGKSRAFVNDTPVKLPLLKTLGNRLIDVHSQHESLQLNKKVYQLQVLDAFAGNDKYLDEFSHRYSAFRSAKTEHDKLVTMASESAEDEDYKQYLFTELERANLDDLNQEELEGDLEVLENAEDIKLKLSQAQQILEGEGPTLLALLGELRSTLGSISSYSGDLEKIHERFESQRLEIEDIANEIGFVMERVEHDPERALEIKTQLDTIYRLQTKHKVNSVDELLKLRDELSDQLALTNDLEGRIKKAEKELEDAYEDMMTSGEKLTESRKLSALDLSAEIEKIIKKIGIENGQVEIVIDRSEPTEHGLDAVDIRFSANKGIAPEDISKVASGGEFSRLIFAIKYLIAGKRAMPTVIFDEIDTGVSGQVAIQMVNMMKEMSLNHQVIAISHLPQFAAGGDAHYFVYKDHTSDRSVSKIKKLEDQERITEIAKMIGGNEPTESAFSSARELLGIG